MSRFCVSQSIALGVLAFIVALGAPQLALAQYLANNFHGDFGVNSGSQAGPGFYVAIPFAQWNADNIKDTDGNTLAASRFQGFDVRAMFPTLLVVTPKKLLGANYGFLVAPPFSTIRPERASLEPFEPDWALNDLYVAVPTTTSAWACGRTKFRLAPRFTSTRRRGSAPRRRRTSRCIRTRKIRT